jgi:hypothetical protein
VGFEYLKAMTVKSTVYVMLALWSGTSLPVFQRNIHPPCSRLKGNNPCKEALLVSCLFALLFDLEDESRMLIKNLNKLFLNYMA